MESAHLACQGHGVTARERIDEALASIERDRWQREHPLNYATTSEPGRDLEIARRIAPYRLVFQIIVEQWLKERAERTSVSRWIVYRWRQDVT